MKTQLYTAFNIGGVILITLLFAMPLHAQNTPWLEVGSEWTFQHGVFSGPEHYQVTYGITEQTTFAGRECAKMERTSANDFGCISLAAPYYFYVSNDSLFYASELDSTYRLISDFGAAIGDSWQYLVVSDYNNSVVVDTFLVTVADANLLSIEGHNLRQLEFNYEWLGSSSSDELGLGLYSGDMTEVIGGLGFFAPFGQFGFCDNETNVTFQCFESPSFSYLNPDYPSCNYVVGIDESDKNKRLSIFPNPAKGTVNIAVLPSLGSTKSTLTIYNSSGKLVYSRSGDFAYSEQIELSTLPSGLYFVGFQSEESRIVQKLVID